jgi:hypothetical protein
LNSRPLRPERTGHRTIRPYTSHTARRGALQELWRSARGQDVGKPRPAETEAALIAQRAVGGPPDLPGGGHRDCPLAATPSRWVIVWRFHDPTRSAIHRHFGHALAAGVCMFWDARSGRPTSSSSAPRASEWRAVASDSAVGRVAPPMLRCSDRRGARRPGPSRAACCASRLVLAAGAVSGLSPLSRGG